MLSMLCRIFGIPASGQRRVQGNDLVELSLMYCKSLCLQKLCTMHLLSLALPVFVDPGPADVLMANVLLILGVGWRKQQNLQFEVLCCTVCISKAMASIVEHRYSQITLLNQRE